MIGIGRIKLLITTGDFSQYIHKSFHYLLIELSKLTDLIVWHRAGSIHNILNELSVTPDFILVNEFGETNSPNITELSSLKIPYGVYLHDLHYKIEQRRKLLNKEKPQFIFTYYRDKFYEYFPEFCDRMIWLPHHVNTEVFTDYLLPKDMDWLLLGAVHKSVYPLRHKILEVMRNKPGFVYYQHPGYRNISEQEKKQVYVWENYAMTINRAKMFLTCDSRYKYPINKYFEVLACNTLLLAPSSPELKDLGFVPGKHFVDITEKDFEEKANYYLDHEKIRKKIAKQGYEMVCKMHSTVNRAKQLVNIIQGIL